jgi:uncharacterized protein (TIGR02145 family)
MKKVIVLTLIFCCLAFSQTSRPKLIVSVSGSELQMDMANSLMEDVSHGILKNANNIYDVKADDKFKEALKKEWKGGNIADERIKDLAKNANADFLCLAKITIVKGYKGKKVSIQLVKLDNMTIERSGRGDIEDDFDNLSHVTKTVLKAVNDMLDTNPSGGHVQTSESYQPPNDNIQYSSFTDSRDYQQYKTIKIGNLTWMAENLKYKMSGSLCYKDDEFNCRKYGRMYDWNNAIKACPSGWRLPSNGEWNDLINTAGKENAGKNLKSKSWKNGTDNLGFSAMPGGRRIDGNFEGIDNYGNWWTSTENGDNANVRFMGNDNDFVGENNRSKSRAYSVRCVQDSHGTVPSPRGSTKTSEEEIAEAIRAMLASQEELNTAASNSGAFTDFRDGQRYRMVKIGSLVWMAENLNYNAKESKCYNNSESNCKKYGRLYNWSTAMKACPANWHLPNEAEWDDLVKAIGNQNVMGKHLKVKYSWNGTDTYGFSALPSGGGTSNIYNRTDIKFDHINKISALWSAKEGRGYNSNDAYRAMLDDDDALLWDNRDKSNFYSVRCVQD